MPIRARGKRPFLDIEPWEQRIQSVFGEDFHVGLRRVSRLVDKLDNIGDEAGEAMERGDYQRASQVLRALLQVCATEGFEAVDDSYGILGDFYRTCLENYQRTMEGWPFDRPAFFADALNLYLTEDYGFSDETIALMLHFGRTDKEFDALERLALKARDRLRDRDAYKHQKVIDLLLKLYDQRGDDKAYLGTCDEKEAAGWQRWVWKAEKLEALDRVDEAIANDVYVEYGAGYDPEYGEYRGFGDDSWIDEMDELFAAATSFFRAGQFQAAADAYVALFDIFHLGQDGFHFTRPDPVQALHTNVDAVKENLFIAIGRSEPEPAVRVIEVSENLRYYGANRYALLNAWQSRDELMKTLERALVDRARRPASQSIALLSHPAELLREFYRRHRALPDFESLCRQVGPQQGWPYQDLVRCYLEQENWEQVLAWAEDGLSKLPADSHYRPLLQEARGQTLLNLDRPAEALDELQALFQQRPWEAQVYLKLRQAAQTVGQWESLYPQLATEMRAHVLTIKGQQSYIDHLPPNDAPSILKALVDSDAELAVRIAEMATARLSGVAPEEVAAEFYDELDTLKVDALKALVEGTTLEERVRYTAEKGQSSVIRVVRKYFDGSESFVLEGLALQ